MIYTLFLLLILFFILYFMFLLFYFLILIFYFIFNLPYFIFWIRTEIPHSLLCDRRVACKESSDETESITIIFSAEINLLWQLYRVWISIKLYYIYIYIYIYIYMVTQQISILKKVWFFCWKIDSIKYNFCICFLAFVFKLCDTSQITTFILLPKLKR